VGFILRRTIGIVGGMSPESTLQLADRVPQIEAWWTLRILANRTDNLGYQPLSTCLIEIDQE
jgi:hypothetical protein